MNETIKTSEVQLVRGKYRCPECGEKFDERRSLGSHRRAHGVVGTAKSTVAYREKNGGGAKRKYKLRERMAELMTVETPAMRRIPVSDQPHFVRASVVPDIGHFVCPHCAHDLTRRIQSTLAAVASGNA